MNIDILNLTEAQIAALSYAQRKILYEGQQKKDELTQKLEKEMENAKLLLIAQGVARSDMLSYKYLALEEDYEQAVEILAKQTLEGMEAAPADGDVTTVTQTEYSYPTNPNYSLSYPDRFAAVKTYYMKMEDAEERYAAFLADTLAKSYLGEYYYTMKYYLKSFI